MSAPASTGRREPGAAPADAARWSPELAVVVVATAVALVVGLLLTGAAAAQALGDPGALVRWALPGARAVHDLTGAVALGALLLAGTALPASGAAFARAVQVGAAAATAWTVAGVLTVVLTYASVAGRGMSEPGFGAELGFFVTSVDLGRYLLIGVLMAAVVATAAFGVRTPTGAGLLALLAAASWFPIALTGHAAGASSHENAVSAWWLHALGVSVWFGGLVTLVLLRGRLGGSLADAAGRYSTLAGWGFALVVVSGAVNAWLRLSHWSDLLNGYGLLVLLKICAAVALGAAGYWHRRATLPALRPSGGAGSSTRAGAGPFWRLVGGELVVFGVAMGLAVALSRSAPPVPDDLPLADPTPAEMLTGEPLPPPLTAVHWLTQWRPDVLWVVIGISAVLVYVAGVRRLRARGDRWPVWRTVLWLLGCAALLYVTSGAPTVYGRVLFSAHMVQHMALAMVVPPLLVFGAPVTLAMRALPRRRDGSRGPREWLLATIESPPARLVSHPVVAAVVFAGSLAVFYFSPLFALALRTHLGHELMMVHFLIAGYLFAQAVVGVDPGPSRPSHPLRLLLLLATMAFHAFFGVTLVSGDTLLAATWFSSMGWGIDALADQQTGGGIAWGVGEFPTLVLALVLAFQWAGSDDREARRRDRAAERDDDAELTAYNAMLARIAERDSREQSR